MASYTISELLQDPTKQKVVEVYFVPKTEKDAKLPTKKKNEPLLAGIWKSSKNKATMTSPQDVWIFSNGKEPSDFYSSKNTLVKGSWGFQPNPPGGGGGGGSFNSITNPTQLWFFGLDDKIPSDVTIQGSWMLPVIKRDDSTIPKDGTGFIPLGKGQGKGKMDVQGNWRLLCQRDGDPMKIYIQRPDGSKFTLTEVDPEDTIYKIKTRIHTQEKNLGPPKEQHLFLPKASGKGDKELDDKPTLKEYDIQDGDTLILQAQKMKIHIQKVVDGTTFTLTNVKPTDSISKIKSKIQEKEKIPSKEQILKFHGKTLENDPTLEEYNVKNGDTLQLDDDSMVIHIRKPDGNTFPLSVKPKDTIKNVKQQVQQKEKVPIDEQRLLFKGKELDNGPTLTDSGIQNGDIIDLEGMQINVKTPEGKIIPLLVKPKDTIQSIKQKVAQKENIPVPDQRLTFGGKELDNASATLTDCKIRHGDTLQLEPMVIKVKTPDGKIFPLTVQPSNTIHDIKKKIQKKDGTPVDAQRLTFKGKPLSNNDPTLSETGIKHGDTVNLEGMEIKVKTPDGKTFPLTVQPTNTIHDIKKKIQKKEGTPVDAQRLTFKGKPLSDNAPTLSETGIKHGDTVNLEGMEIKVKTPEGDIIPLIVLPTDTIQDIKKKVQGKEGTPVEKQHLSHDRKPLDNDKNTIEEEGIQHGDVLDLKRKMVIYVKMPYQKIVTLNVISTWRIRDVKKEVQKMEGIPVNEHVLFFKKTELDDKPSLADYKIVDKSTLNLEAIPVSLVEMSPWQSPLNSPVPGSIGGGSGKPKVKRDGLLKEKRIPASWVEYHKTVELHGKEAAAAAANKKEMEVKEL